MKKIVLLLFFLILGAYFRFYNLPSRVPFEWDQERDMQVIREMVGTYRPTLIGPVVRGEGGFMLGPLYTYLLIPGYLLSGGNPLSAPVTNIIIDLLVGTGLFVLSSYAGIIWFISPLIIAQSLISWNVGLISLWVLVLIFLHRKYQKEPSRLLPLSFLVLGFSWHIHASLIPLSFALSGYYLLAYRLALTPKIIILSFLAYLLPLFPLILFDLRHDFVNWQLLLNFLGTSSTDKPEAWGFVILEVVKKLLIYLQNIFSGKSSLLTVLLVFVLLGFGLKKVDKPILFYFLASLALSILFLILYRNPFFPDYYLSVILVPFIYLFGTAVQGLPKYLLLLFFLLLLRMLVINKVEIVKTATFSLRIKENLVNKLATLPQPLDIRYELSPGRDNGFAYLYARSQVVDSEEGKIHVVLKDTPSAPNKIDDREPSELSFFGPYQLEIYSTPVVE